MVKQLANHLDKLHAGRDLITARLELPKEFLNVDLEHQE